MKVHSILVVNMNYLGDALMTTPAVRALKKAFEKVRIDVIAGSSANYGALEILSLDPDIDRLIPRINGGSLARGAQLFKIIVKDRYDLVVILPSLPFYSFIAKLTGRRVVTVPKADESKHMADHMLDAVMQMLPKSLVTPRSFVMNVPDQSALFAAELFKKFREPKRLVVFNMGASRPQKRRPAAHFAKAAAMVVDSGFNLALVGGENEQDKDAACLVMTAVADANLCGSVINIVGKTTLEQLAAVIKAGSVVVTADTGAMHIASALETPLVALFGSTKPGFTGPYGEGGKTAVLDIGLSCAPCGTHPTCNGRYDCMTGISPEYVLESILKLTNVSEEIVACGIS